MTRLLVSFTLALCVGLAAAPALADNGSDSTWKLGYYTPSGRALSMASAPGSDGSLAMFNFTAENNTALLVTTHGAAKGTLLGDLRGDTIAATMATAGVTGAFTYYGEPSCGGTTANVRFFFTTDNGGGFDFTHYWWSNPVAHALTNDETFTLMVPVSPEAWSDWDGKSGSIRTAGFEAAAVHVTMIGLSFGGGCFFENGVGTSDGSGTFTLETFTVT